MDKSSKFAQRPTGIGKLILKGGDTLTAPAPEKKRKRKKVVEETGEPGSSAVAEVKKAAPVNPTAVSVQSGKTYEAEFEFEELRSKDTNKASQQQQQQQQQTCYSSKVTGKDAIERLDIRCARKADKFCK
ncbi:MAG: hypothetical protein WDW38_008260 [Sanguina aurantia]